MLHRFLRPLLTRKTSYRFSSRALAVALLSVFFALSSCKKELDPDPTNPTTPVPTENDPLTPTAQVNTTVAGKVVGEDGKAIAGAQVTVNGKSATTATDGTFMVSDVRVPGNRCVITAQKTGYFNSVRAAIPTKDHVTRTTLVLATRETTHTLDAATGGKAALANGSEVQIPANGLVTASGNAYTGSVNMSVRYQDPSANDFSRQVAGGDMLAQRTDASTSVLYSYGILRVLMTGANGEELQIAEGQTSTLTIAIPDNQLSTAPPTIPLWYFDEEAGIWKEEGEATKQGNKYIGTVKHFTDWNADDPKKSATIIGKVVDCNGNVIPLCPVQVGQIDLEAEGTGAFSQRVPTGVNLQVKIAPYSGKFYGKMIVLVPPLSPGQVYDVGTLQSTDFCPSKVKGRLKVKAGDEVESVVFSEKNGSVELWQPGNSFEATLPAKTSFTMKIYTAKGVTFTKTFESPETKSEMDLGEIDLNQAPIKVSGLVTCGDTYLAGATVKLDWADQTATTTTDEWGFFEYMLPSSESVTAGITHAKGTKIISFQTSSDPSKVQSLPTTNLCDAPVNVGQNSFVITGDGFNNALQTLGYDEIQSYAAYGLSINTPDNTIASISAPSNTWRMSIVFGGKSVGVIGGDKYANVILQRKEGANDITYIAGVEVEDSNVKIEVTKYGPVGGLVEGTFSGTFVGVSTSGEEMKVTITQGKFSAIRLPDLL